MLSVDNITVLKPVIPIPEKMRNAGDVCPITRISVEELGKDSYNANDGYVYQKESLAVWLEKSNLSPMTKQALNADKRVLVGVKTNFDHTLNHIKTNLYCYAVILGAVKIGLNVADVVFDIDPTISDTAHMWLLKIIITQAGIYAAICGYQCNHVD
ncbi:MAG: hypothetical protein EOO38_02225 [Cytophagaceae bacterium]|nr:MAG: hypothetical protein EOO38_02225 [Cytophagaceae bacterium]